MVFRRSSGDIAWSCDACGDEGLIRGWEGSPADLSDLDDSEADGDEPRRIVARELFEAIRDVLVLDDDCELLIARAEGSAAGVVLTGRAGAFEQLAEVLGALGIDPRFVDSEIAEMTRSCRRRRRAVRCSA